MENTNKTVGKTTTDGVRVTETPKRKSYVVVWHYMANYGTTFVTATNPAEAIRNHMFFDRKDIQLIAFENSNKTSAFKDVGSSDVINPFEVEVARKVGGAN